MIKARSVINNAIWSSSIGLIGRFLGIISTLLVAYFFGATYKTDFILYIIVFLSAINIFFNGFNGNIALSQFIIIKEKVSEEEAWRFVNTVFTVISFLILVISIVLFFNFRKILLFFSGFTLQQIESMQLSVLLLIPCIYFSYVSDLMFNIINAYKNYSTTSVIQVIGGIVNLIVIFFMIKLVNENAIVLGYFFSCLAQFILLLTYLYFHGKKLKICFHRFYNFNTILKLTPTVILSQISAIIVLMYPIFLATRMDSGTLTAINYAKRIYDILPIILIYPITVVLTPRLTELALLENKTIYIEYINKVIAILLAVIIPITIFLSMNSYSIILLLFGRGAFIEPSVSMTAISMAIYMVGIFVLCSNSVITRALLATQKVKIAYVSLIFSIAPAFLLTPLSYYLTKTYGYVGIPLANTLYLIGIHLLLGYLFFYKYIGKFSLIKIIMTYFIIGFLSFFVIFISQIIIGNMHINYIIKICITFMFSALLYMYGNYLLKTEGYIFIKDLLKKRGLFSVKNT